MLYYNPAQSSQDPKQGTSTAQSSDNPKRGTSSTKSWELAQSHFATASNHSELVLSVPAPKPALRVEPDTCPHSIFHQHQCAVAGFPRKRNDPCSKRPKRLVGLTFLNRPECPRPPTAKMVSMTEIWDSRP